LRKIKTKLISKKAIKKFKKINKKLSFRINLKIEYCQNSKRAKIAMIYKKYKAYILKIMNQKAQLFSCQLIIQKEIML